jgi:CelD/BcsL family acetyltransferase involved in cellulose biosynthesis/predicted ATP-grasp superfamily ATP-dependent carboligase
MYAPRVPLRVELLDSLAAIEPYREEWDRLAVEAGRPYCTPAWSLAWWRHVSAPGARLRVVAALDGARLVGIAALCVDREARGAGRYRFAGAPHGTRIEPLAGPGRAEEVAATLTGALERIEPAVERLELAAVPASSPWPRLLARSWPGRRRPWVHASRATPAPRVTLAAQDLDGWLGSKSRNFRQQMRRGRRQLEEQGAVFRVAEASSLAADLSAFARLHRARWSHRGGSRALVPGALDALAEAGQGLVGSGRFRLASIELDGEHVATHLFLSAGPEVAYWLGGFDERWAAQRPSMVALVDELGAALRRGEAFLDLGPEGQDYKYRLADAEEQLVTFTLVPGGAAYAAGRLRFAPRQARVGLSRRVPDERRERLVEHWRRAASRVGVAPRHDRDGEVATARAPAALVTDADLRSVLAGIRGLGRAGVPVVVVAPRRDAPGLWSRHASARLVGVGEQDGLLAAVASAARERGPVVAYPGQEATIDVFLDGWAWLPPEVLRPYPAPEPVRLLRDKRALAGLAAEAGLGAPATLVEGTAGELSRTRPALPCVLKPAHAGGALPTARPVGDVDELQAILATLPPDEPLLVQERMPGGLWALAVVIDPEGRLVARFQQAALRTWPPSAGNSSCAVSVAPDATLVARAAGMLRDVGYGGLAQLQFVGGPGERALIDANLRFYGSLPLALAAGVNLPAAWHAAVTGRHLPPPGPYRVGVSYRWLAGDAMAAVNGSPQLLLRPRRTDVGAIWSADDPLPGLLSATRTAATIVVRRLRAVR